MHRLSGSMGRLTFCSQAREMQGQLASLSDSRGVLRLAGVDLITFLQGLLTNDMRPLQAAGAAPMYAALLNPQGRFLHDLFLHQQQADSEPVILADVDQQGLPDLKRLLARYKLRAKVDVADVSDEQRVWARFGAGLPSTDSWPSDPRLQALGQRFVLSTGDKPSSSQGEPETEGSAYRRWRIEHGVAEGDTEIPTGHAVALEYNLDGLNAISFDKGCYVGQELIARSHYRGVVRKRVMPVHSEPGSEVLQPGQAITAPGAKKPVGTVATAEGARGLAVLRLEPALQAVTGSAKLQTEAGAEIKPWRPDWWPEVWGKEEQ